MGLTFLQNITSFLPQWSGEANLFEPLAVSLGHHPLFHTVMCAAMIECPAYNYIRAFSLPHERKMTMNTLLSVPEYYFCTTFRRFTEFC